MSIPYVIETHEISNAYKSVQALRSLDLKVHQNSIFVFPGPNGAGKTTIKHMLGLIRLRTDRLPLRSPSFSIFAVSEHHNLERSLT
jgi:ABC-type multidrug transport system ATPase subunit